MGITTFPCPSCGQQQKETHENGQEVRRRLCAACQEDLAKIFTSSQGTPEKEKALAELCEKYGIEAPAFKANEESEGAEAVQAVRPGDG
jgi:hypothetical protein